MKWRTGGQAVGPGFYWSRARWEILTVDRQGFVLPGGPAEAYVRMAAPIALAVAPAMGGLFAMFLPLIGFVMVTRALASRATRPFRRSRTA